MRQWDITFKMLKLILSMASTTKHHATATKETQFNRKTERREIKTDWRTTDGDHSPLKCARACSRSVRQICSLLHLSFTIQSHFQLIIWFTEKLYCTDCYRLRGEREREKWHSMQIKLKFTFGSDVCECVCVYSCHREKFGIQDRNFSSFNHEHTKDKAVS